MKKPKTQFDPDKLFIEHVPNQMGGDGEDPRIKHIRQLHMRGDTEKAQVFFDRLHARFAHKKDFEWLEKIKKHGN